MSSLGYHITCPHCGSVECSKDFYNKTSETFISCPICCYFKHTKDNSVIKEISHPYGSIDILFKGELVHIVGTVASEEDYHAAVDELTDIGLDKVQSAILSRVVEGKRIATNVI